MELSAEPGLIVCPNPKCHRKIEQPILLSDLSLASAEQYYACPHCFIKLDAISTLTQKQKEEEKKRASGQTTGEERKRAFKVRWLSWVLGMSSQKQTYPARMPRLSKSSGMRNGNK